MPVAASFAASLAACGILVPGSICIPLPGGAEICPPGAVIIPDPTELIIQLFVSLNSALSPLMPFFRVIDVALALFACVQAIPDALSLPPQPQKVLACVPKLAQAIAELIKLIPAISLPFTIAGFLDALILFLTGLKGNLLAIINQLERIIAAETAAIGPPVLPSLAGVAICARAQMNSEMANLNAMFTPLNRLLGVINLLLTLTGQSPLPTFSNLGDDPRAALDLMDPLIETFVIIRSFIPV